ncbi:MAG: hypothetical protein ACTSU2_06005 [Promethearchaeota archaeon]
MNQKNFDDKGNDNMAQGHSKELRCYYCDKKLTQREITELEEIIVEDYDNEELELIFDKLGPTNRDPDLKDVNQYLHINAVTGLETLNICKTCFYSALLKYLKEVYGRDIFEHAIGKSVDLNKTSEVFKNTYIRSKVKSNIF